MLEFLLIIIKVPSVFLCINQHNDDIVKNVPKFLVFEI